MCMFVCVSVCVHMRVCVRIFVCVCVSCVRAYMHMCVSVYVQTINTLFYHANNYLHRSKPTLSRSEKKALQTKRDYINQNVRPAKVTINVHDKEALQCQMIHISNGNSNTIILATRSPFINILMHKDV